MHVNMHPQLRHVTLAPLHLRRTTTRLVGYYAFFKGWLLLSQPPSCLSLPTSFPTELEFGTLAGGLGCFPFDYGFLPRLRGRLTLPRLTLGRKP